MKSPEIKGAPNAEIKPVELPEEIEKKIASGEFDIGDLKHIDPKLHPVIAKKMIETGDALSVTCYLEKFEGIDYKEMAMKLIESGWGHCIADNLDKFEGLNKEVLMKFIEAGQSEAVASYLDKFEGLDKNIGLILLKKLMPQDISLAVKVNEYFNGSIDKILDKAYQDFGNFLTFEIYDLYTKLEDEEILKEAAELGVKHDGKTGMNELKNALRDVQRQFIEGDIDILLESALAKRWIMSLVRYEDSFWGDHDEESFVEIVEKYIKVKDEIRPLPEEYEPSKKMNIAKIDKDKQAEFKYSEDFLVRYGTLLGSIKESRALIDEKNSLNQILDFIKEKRQRLLSEIDEKIAKQKNPKAIENLKNRKKQLESINLEVLSNPQEAFSTLRSFKSEFDEELREIMFYFGFYSNPQQQRENLDEFDAQNPTLEQLSWILNFVDHITNQETLKEYFTDKRAAKHFKGLLNISALQQEMARWQNRATKGTMSMKFIPTRNLLTEFSGHIGDSCWASKYGSIIEKFPNFISLTMVQNPGDLKHERLAGSSLLIETVSAEDEQLLVIRGLNPQENVINQLDAEDFYKKLVNYLKPIAKKTGRKLAIVIDGHSGGSATNRPILFAYLEKLKKKLKQVKLKSNDDTNFNDYDIRNDCYLVE